MTSKSKSKSSSTSQRKRQTRKTKAQQPKEPKKAKSSSRDRCNPENRQTSSRPRPTVPLTIRVLGVDDTGAIMLWIKDRREMRRVRNLRELDNATMVQIAGECFLQAGLTLEQAKEGIALEARKKSFSWDKLLGQGVWREGGKLIVSGNQAAVIKSASSGDKETFSFVGMPKIGTKLLDFKEGALWTDLKALSQTYQSVTTELAIEVWREVQSMLGCWKFQNPCDRTLITGLLFLTPIQGYLDYRPQVWVTGRTNVGKTALLEFIEKLLPGCSRFDSETTEAALRQHIGHDVLPVLLDEFEHWRGRDDIIALLRTATRGGMVAKGTSAGSPTTFGLRHIAWGASIEIGLKRAADWNRFLTFELLEPDEIRVPSKEELSPLGQKLLAVAIKIAESVRKQATELGRMRFEGADRRLVESHGLAVAVWGVIHNKAREEMEAYLESVLKERSDLLAEVEKDEELLVTDILGSKLTGQDDLGHPSYKTTTVSQALMGKYDDALLNINGIRRLDDGRVFFAPGLIVRYLLKDTRWADHNIGAILARLPGAERGKQRVGKPSLRGVKIPIERLYEYGLEKE